MVANLQVSSSKNMASRKSVYVSQGERKSDFGIWGRKMRRKLDPPTFM
jgi:hypothetical protein